MKLSCRPNHNVSTMIHIRKFALKLISRVTEFFHNAA
jgi:hypothetical protein